MESMVWIKPEATLQLLVHCSPLAQDQRGQPAAAGGGGQADQHRDSGPGLRQRRVRGGLRNPDRRSLLAAAELQLHTGSKQSQASRLVREFWQSHCDLKYKDELLRLLTNL